MCSLHSHLATCCAHARTETNIDFPVGFIPPTADGAHAGAAGADAAPDAAAGGDEAVPAAGETGAGAEAAFFCQPPLASRHARRTSLTRRLPACLAASG